MIAYPDTSFLCALYRMQENSARAARHFSGMDEPLHIASPLVYEFRQSTRFQAWLHLKDRGKGFDPATARSVLSIFQANLASGALLVIPVDWPDLVSIAEKLSHKHTWTGGHRGYDILHVATAIHLGARDFLTFDGRQKQLAEAEGLRVPL